MYQHPETYGISEPEELLKGNSYPGRGIMIGVDSEGEKSVIAYFIMGRSDNSRNRVFVKDGGDLMIKPYDSSKVEDPSLIIYYPVRTLKDHIIVTNGDQTDTVRDFIEKGDTFKDALDTRKFEPDSPNFTPRISGLVDKGTLSYHLSILKSGDPEGNTCARFYYDYQGVPGTGHFIHTYEKDGSPLPTFTGEPERISIDKDIDEFTDSIWTSLDTDNKISLYVRYTDINTGSFDERIVNKYE